MRIAALYDIHGNLPALEAVLEEIDASGVEEIVVGGDVVPGPMARECLERLLALTVPTQFIAGNCEREMLALHAGATSSLPKEVQATCRWTAEQLGDSALRTIGRWPPTLRLNHGSLGDTLFCHATPRSDSEIFTRLAPDEELQRIFGGVNAAIVVCGHTHVQFERRLDDMTILNAGSVGMPFQAAGAYWLLLAEAAELRRTDYDYSRAAERIRGTRYPQAEEFADRFVLQRVAC